MGVGVEDAVPHGLLEDRPEEQAGRPARPDAALRPHPQLGPVATLDGPQEVGHADAFDPLHRDDAPAAEGEVDPGSVVVDLVLRHQPVEEVHVSGLPAEVELFVREL